MTTIFISRPSPLTFTEHYRLGSGAAILSRGFCDANRVENPEDVRDIFIEGVKNIRLKEEEVASLSQEEYTHNLESIQEKVQQIVSKK